MERVVYIRGKFKGTSKEMKEAYFYVNMMIKLLMIESKNNGYN